MLRLLADEDLDDLAVQALPGRRGAHLLSPLPTHQNLANLVAREEQQVERLGGAVGGLGRVVRGARRPCREAVEVIERLLDLTG